MCSCMKKYHKIRFSNILKEFAWTNIVLMAPAVGYFYFRIENCVGETFGWFFHKMAGLTAILKGYSKIQNFVSDWDFLSFALAKELSDNTQKKFAQKPQFDAAMSLECIVFQKFLLATNNLGLVWDFGLSKNRCFALTYRQNCGDDTQFFVELEQNFWGREISQRQSNFERTEGTCRSRW